MPLHTLSTAASSIFNFSQLLRSLPSNTRVQTLTKCSACLFSTTPLLESIGKKKKKPRRRLDPYRAAQARQRKTANLARQDVLQRERQEAMGDPIRSKATPDLLALLNASAKSEINADGRLNYFLDQRQVGEALAHSKWLTEPLPAGRDELDPAEFERRKKVHAEQHENAEEALTRIMNLDNGSSKDRTRVTIQRCIDMFGRHETDKTLPPKPASIDKSGSVEVSEWARKRAGPDTGSSEVQAAILTAKINVLADNLGKKDKHNKRNLRLLVHKRQKHLSYLRRKERGGPRWQHLVEKLGISDAMWKGEISI